MDAFNNGLKAIAEESGCGYVDVSTPLKGEDDALIREYSSDKYVHLSNAGLAVWVQSLRSYARIQALKGKWVPEELKDVLSPVADKPGTEGPNATGPGTPEPKTKEPGTSEQESPNREVPERVYEGPAHRNGGKQ